MSNSIQRLPASANRFVRRGAVPYSFVAIDSVNPGDDAPVGTPGTGESICPVCGGTGVVSDRPCTECAGSGKVNVGIGGG